MNMRLFILKSKHMLFSEINSRSSLSRLWSSHLSSAREIISHPYESLVRPPRLLLLWTNCSVARELWNSVLETIVSLAKVGWLEWLNSWLWNWSRQSQSANKTLGKLLWRATRWSASGNVASVLSDEFKDETDEAASIVVVLLRKFVAVLVWSSKLTISTVLFLR